MINSDKLRILADAAKYDASCASSGASRKGTPEGLGNSDGTGICHSYTPDGRCVSLLKILLTNYCIYDCQYCVNRVSSDVAARAIHAAGGRANSRWSSTAATTSKACSSAPASSRSADYTMEQLVAVARCLRQDHGFGGYIHLKLIPGASPRTRRRRRPLRGPPQRQHRAADAGRSASACARQDTRRDRTSRCPR